jgi:hypothetical protein
MEHARLSCSRRGAHARSRQPFIIDSPWLPNWAGHTILDYFTDERVFLDDNLKAIRAFPETIFCRASGRNTECAPNPPPSAPSASCGARTNFPFAKKVLRSVSDVERLEKPDPRKHGLLPFVIKRLKHLQPEIEKAGHKIRFAVARGPLNIASFLMGTPEFLEAIKTDPELMHRLLAVVTDFLVDWIAVSARGLPVDRRHLSARRYRRIREPPRLRDLRPALFAARIQRGRDREVLPQRCAVQGERAFAGVAGINLLNFGIQHTLTEMKAWTNNRIALMGNIPPRDVLAEGTPADVAALGYRDAERCR